MSQPHEIEVATSSRHSWPSSTDVRRACVRRARGSRRRGYTKLDALLAVPGARDRRCSGRAAARCWAGSFSASALTGDLWRIAPAVVDGRGELPAGDRRQAAFSIEFSTPDHRSS